MYDELSAVTCSNRGGGGSAGGTAASGGGGCSEGGRPPGAGAGLSELLRSSFDLFLGLDVGESADVGDMCHKVAKKSR